MITYDRLKDRILKDGFFDINDIDFDINIFENDTEFKCYESNIYEDEVDVLHGRTLRAKNYQ